MNKIKKVFRQSSRRWTWFLYRKRAILKAKLKDLIADKDNIKFHIGCGDKKFEGYINIDIIPAEGTDVVMDVAKELHLVPSNIALEIRLESVFEHFYRYQQRKILQEFHRILKDGGTLIIKWLPDFDAIIEAYSKKAKGIVGEEFDLFNVYRLAYGDPTPKNSPQQLHKDIFTKETIRKLLEGNGFQIKILKNEAFAQERLALSINIIATKQ